MGLGALRRGRRRRRGRDPKKRLLLAPSSDFFKVALCGAP
jgi:hypothetical protein